MAISAPHFAFLKELHDRGVLPQGGSLLEIGEANWYGDIEPPEQIQQIVEPMRDSPLLLFAIVKAVYGWLLGTSDVTSIDMNGSPAALRFDLNQPIQLGRKFSTVINNGTAEHVFNLANVFKVMHDHCKVGGLMIHDGPFTGWIDHGFVTLQPTLFYDLAAANHYEIRYFAVAEIQSGRVDEYQSREEVLVAAADGTVPMNAMLFVAMAKMRDEKFIVPYQGYYTQTLSEAASQAWSELR